MGLSTKSATATINNLASPFTARNGSQAETQVYWVDPTTNNGWAVGYRPSYGGMPFSAWYEINNGVWSVTQIADTTRPDGFIHVLEQLGSTYAGSEDPQFTATEQAPTGTLVRRRY